MQRPRLLLAAPSLLASIAACGVAHAQVEDDDTWIPTFGTRPIDKLPKSRYAEPEDYRGWDEPDPPADYELLCHPKELFRVGDQGVERLCVIEARHPEDETGAVSLVLRAQAGSVLWRAEAGWVGPNQRMRPCWMPVWLGGGQHVELIAGGRVRTHVEARLEQDAPPALIDLSAPDRLLAVDAGFALLPEAELCAMRGAPLRLRVGLAGNLSGALTVTAGAAPDQVFRIGTTGTPQTVEFGIPTSHLAAMESPLHVAVTVDGETVAERDYRLHLRDDAADVRFGAEYTDLRFTAPVRDGDGERSWDEIWSSSRLRDVVVRFPGEQYRMAFWRGANYVACWALPEAWLTYEWLEAEPDFYGAVGCVEPLQDKDCQYSRVEITSSTPARAVVSWEYALTDLEVKIIRGERAEEVFTLYPDGVGTRYMRGFYQSGWHENQEFIVVNRPGRWPSMALDPQAITFLSPDGDRQAPVWPKPGFELRGWPQVISIVNLGRGPRPFMVTPAAPSQVKVWADPYVDKPDLFNSYPHWPVTRGMRTSWLDDPADFRYPTHSNLANLVNSPIQETDTEKDFLWLIGMGRSQQEILDLSRCWLNPGQVVPDRSLEAKGYSQTERAYVLSVVGPDAPQECQFTLAPEADTPVIDPAFMIEGWPGPADASVPGAEEFHIGREGADQAEERLVVWVRGRFAEATKISLTRTAQR